MNRKKKITNEAVSKLSKVIGDDFHGFMSEICIIISKALGKHSADFYCQEDIEGRVICDNQCDHCVEYYKQIEDN